MKFMTESRPSCRLMMALAALLLVVSPARAVVNVLVEAESLASLGGWQMDAQFSDVMGSSMLIAHGMGIPVTNATGTASFPETGDYAVWVRTRNWVPAFSNSAAPGRFGVAVNGVDLAPVFGTEGAAWHWQSGGTVTVSGANATVTLKDLTGFDGRCDAIAFIKGASVPPPDSGPALATWRRTVLNETVDPTNSATYDCVIVGGGMAGCAAAVAAARSGVRVALVQDRPVLGGNASQDIRVATRGEKRHPIVEELDSTDLGNRDNGTLGRDILREMVVTAETNITLIMPWRAYGAGTNAAGRVSHVDVRHTQTGERRRLYGTIFIDCTGDGWIGYWAGAEYRTGREAASEFGESLAPAVADAKTMGNSLMWKSRNAGVSNAFPAVPWALDVAGTRADTGGDWNWEYGMSLNTITDAEAIRDHLLRAIYGNFWNAKQKATNVNLALDWVPFVAGKRESRRLMGDHILKQGDLVNGIYFEDAIATTDWGIDLHSETAVSYLSTYKKTAIKKCYFPFRCLYSRNIPNLMMAGRCFSTTHVAIGSPRVQNTTAQMGVAVGYAAGLCKMFGIEPRAIYRDPARTLELQARIAGAWPDRPLPAGMVVDNTNASPRVVLVGAWTSSAFDTGYYGTNYLHDGSAGRGTKRAAFTPVLSAEGSYSVAMRWTAGSNRATNTPVWVCTTSLAATATSSTSNHLRCAQPDSVFTSNEVWVGRVASNDYMRGLLRFDLSGIPTSAVVVGASLELEIAAKDDASVTGFVGADGLKAYLVTQAFVAAEATWNRRSATSLWAAAGGDLDPVALATIGTPTDPDLADAGDVFAFPASDALVAAAARSVSLRSPLGVMIRTPTLESSYPARKLYRFGTASLEVHYLTVALPATYVVNQQANGSTWNVLGRHQVGSDGLTVVIGNDGASGYVVADAVQFYQAGASTNDLDGDGLSDLWERYYYVSETAGQPLDDPDGDGQNNFVESMTGTDPFDAKSRFDMRAQLDAAPGQFVMQWPSSTGSTYRIERSFDLSTFSPFETGIAATPPLNTRGVPRGESNVYYRVILESTAP